jgi:hypothetical protein
VYRNFSGLGVIRDLPARLARPRSDAPATAWAASRVKPPETVTALASKRCGAPGSCGRASAINEAETIEGQAGSSRRTVVTRSIERSNETITPTPVRSALATR